MSTSLFKSSSLLLSICFLVMLGCPVFAQQEVSKVKVIDPANMDITVKPGNDFMKYAGGIWLQNNAVPAKETRWGSFTILRDFNIKAVREILMEAAADRKAAPGSVKKRVGDFYFAAMDSLSVEKAGFDPVRPDYVRAGAVKSSVDVLNEIIFQRVNGIGTPLFGFFPLQQQHFQLVVVKGKNHAVYGNVREEIEVTIFKEICGS